MNFVTIADLQDGATETVVGFEQHGFGVPVLRVLCEPALEEPLYFPPCEADPDMALVLMPCGKLTEETLAEGVRVYARRSDEREPMHGAEVVLHRWAPLDAPQTAELVPNELGSVFLHPLGEMRCKQLSSIDWR